MRLEQLGQRCQPWAAGVRAKTLNVPTLVPLPHCIAGSLSKLGPEGPCALERPRGAVEEAGWEGCHRSSGLEELRSPLHPGPAFLDSWRAWKSAEEKRGQSQRQGRQLLLLRCFVVSKAFATTDSPMLPMIGGVIYFLQFCTQAGIQLC